MARPSSCELMPFLALAISQIEASHLSSGIGESSKIVPTLTENWRRQSLFLHFQSRRVLTYPRSLLPQGGHSGPLGQRSMATNSFATSRSLKYLMAWIRVFGGLLFVLTR